MSTPKWVKLFLANMFNNDKGVAARATDVCGQYPADDPGVWRR